MYFMEKNQKLIYGIVEFRAKNVILVFCPKHINAMDKFMIFFHKVHLFYVMKTRGWFFLWTLRISKKNSQNRQLANWVKGPWSKTNLPFEWDKVSLRFKPPCPHWMRHLKYCTFWVKFCSMWKMNQNLVSSWRENVKKCPLSQ